MNYSKAIFLINSAVRGVRVKYLPENDIYGSKNPGKADDADGVLFKTLDEDLAEGDFVIIPTKTRYKMTVCKVVEIDVDPDLEAPGECRWIIGKVDTSDYERLQKQEAEAIARIKRANDRQQRAKLREALLADAAADDIKALPIYSVEEKPGHKPD